MFSTSYLGYFFALNFRNRSNRNNQKMKKLLCIASSLLILSQAQFNINVQTSGANLIQNGDFSQPNISENQSMFYGSIGAWQGPFLTVVKGSQYDNKFPEKGNNQVFKLDYSTNAYVYQKMNLQGGFYKLSFNFMAQKNLNLKQGFLEVYWNKKIVATIYLKNYQVAAQEIQVQGWQGQNELLFQQSNNNQFVKVAGIIIDNVKLIRQSKQPTQKLNKPQEIRFNYIKNGDFQAPAIACFKIFDKNIYGWQGRKIQIGKSEVYNMNHDRYRNNQVMQVDVTQNQYISQTIQFLPAGKYDLIFDCAAVHLHDLETSKLEIYWNKEKINFVESKNYNLLKIEMEILAKQGTNELGFKGVGGSDGYGMSIDNIKLYRKPAQLIEQKILQNNKPNAISHENKISNTENKISNNENKIFPKDKIAIPSYELFQSRVPWDLERKNIGLDYLNSYENEQLMKINNKLIRNFNSHNHEPIHLRHQGKNF